MYLNVNAILLSTIISLRSFHCQDVKFRGRRFASVVSLLDQWVGRDGEEYARPEKYVPPRGMQSNYEERDKFEYLGRPKGFLANFLHWDEKYESMGPTLTRVVGLAKDLLEHTDIIQSLLTKSLVSKRKVYDSVNSEREDGHYIESNIKS